MKGIEISKGAKGANCYDCVHYYARAFEGGNRAVRLDGCRLASNARPRHPGLRVAETCPDYNIAATHEKK